MVSADHLSSCFQARPTIHMLPFQDLPTDLTWSSRKGISKPKCETLRIITKLNKIHKMCCSFNMNDGSTHFNTCSSTENGNPHAEAMQMCRMRLEPWRPGPGHPRAPLTNGEETMNCFAKTKQAVKEFSESENNLEVLHCNPLWLKFFGACSSIMAHHYQILCLQQTASHEEIRLAFKRRALQETGSVLSITFVGVYSK